MSSQVLLVAGGDNGAYIDSKLSSTEVLTADSSAWTITSPLPRALTGLKGLNLGGRIYMTGKSFTSVLNMSCTIYIRWP